MQITIMVNLILTFLISFSLNAYSIEADIFKRFEKAEVFALMRHSIAPGGGDPDNFSLRNCSTQRNLSQEGREQSVRIGQVFKDNGIEAANIFSSQWCRCLETARLLELGTVQELPAINSFFQAFNRQKMQTDELKDWLTAYSEKIPAILVTHQVNITALTGIFPSQGEIIFVRVGQDGSIINEGRHLVR